MSVFRTLRLRMGPERHPSFFSSATLLNFTKLRPMARDKKPIFTHKEKKLLNMFNKCQVSLIKRTFNISDYKIMQLIQQSKQHGQYYESCDDIYFSGILSREQIVKYLNGDDKSTTWDANMKDATHKAIPKVTESLHSFDETDFFIVNNKFNLVNFKKRSSPIIGALSYNIVLQVCLDRFLTQKFGPDEANLHIQSHDYSLLTQSKKCVKNIVKNYCYVEKFTKECLKSMTAYREKHMSLMRADDSSQLENVSKHAVLKFDLATNSINNLKNLRSENLRANQHNFHALIWLTVDYPSARDFFLSSDQKFADRFKTFIENVSHIKFTNNSLKFISNNQNVSPFWIIFTMISSFGGSPGNSNES